MRFLKDHNPADRLLDDGKTYELLEYVALDIGSDIIVAPQGYVTDYASSPWWAWWIVPPRGKYSKAAVIHDILYHAELYSRDKCDEIFYEAMKLLGVKEWRRKLMYKAVKLGGGFTWRKHTPESVKKGRDELIRGSKELGTHPPGRL